MWVMASAAMRERWCSDGRRPVQCSGSREWPLAYMQLPSSSTIFASILPDLPIILRVPLQVCPACLAHSAVHFKPACICVHHACSSSLLISNRLVLLPLPIDPTQRVPRLDIGWLRHDCLLRFTTDARFCRCLLDTPSLAAVYVETLHCDAKA
ncbi:hypothetical protein DOTSEDRAFT_70942, partial [Dothistroma septosporum NZE10]